MRRNIVRYCLRNQGKKDEFSVVVAIVVTTVFLLSLLLDMVVMVLVSCKSNY